MSDSGRGGAAVIGATNDLQNASDPNDPNNPTNAAYYVGDIPPWIKAGYPDFASWSAAIGSQKAADEAYRQGQIALQNKQINATSGASGASTVNAGIAANTAANSLAEQQRQFNLQFGQQGSQYQSTQDMDRAKFNAQQQLAEAQAAGMFRGQPTEQAREFNSKQALDYYNSLATNASNPRNFVQSFFQQRGELPPAAANGQGNVDAIQRYLPFLLGGAQGQQSAMQQAPSAQPVNQTATSAPSGNAYSAQTNGASRVSQALGPGVSFASGNLGANGQATSPATTLGGQHPLLPGQTEDPTFQTFRQNVAQNAMGGNVSQEQAMNPKDVGPNGLAIYAHGGIVPEPVIGRGVHSGKTYVFGEHGPEGVVPANYLPQFLQQRHGQQMGGQNAYAVGGIIGDNSNPSGFGDPYTPPPPPDSGGNMLDPGLTSNYAGPGGYQVDSNTVNQVLNPTPAPAPTNNNNLTPTASGAASAPTTGVTILTPDAIAAMNAPQRTSTAAPVQPYVAPATPSFQQTTPVPLTPQNNFNPFPPPAPASAPTAAPAPTGSVSPTVNQPLGAPQPSNNFNTATAPTPDFGAPIPQGVPGTPTAQNYLPTSLFPRDVSAPGTFGNKIASQGPRFLPGEDQPDPNSVLGQLNSLNAIPPFLTRLFAQGKGIASMGTNQPQRMDIPKDVPLVSKLAYSQMSPSEQQALLSYASAYGITPEDYMALIEQYAPQGPASHMPTFGTPLTFQRQ